MREKGGLSKDHLSSDNGSLNSTRKRTPRDITLSNGSSDADMLSEGENDSGTEHHLSRSRNRSTNKSSITSVGLANGTEKGENEEDAALRWLTGSYRRSSQARKDYERYCEKQRDNTERTQNQDSNGALLQEGDSANTMDEDYFSDNSNDSNNCNDDDNNDDNVISRNEGSSQDGANHFSSRGLPAGNTGNVGYSRNFWRAQRDSGTSSDSTDTRSDSDANARSFRNALGRFLSGTGFEEILADGSEIKGMIEQLRVETDPYIVQETLNEISGKLLMMNGLVAERGLPVMSLTTELVSILNDPKYQQLLETQLIACRCLYNILEVSPEAVHTMVECDVIEALSSRLTVIDYIDLAEQALQTLEVISRDAGDEIMERSNASMYLTYLDFFTIHSQRKALSLLVNSCDHIPKSKLAEIKDILPTVERVATEYTDSSCVESAWLAISKIIRNFEKDPKILSELIKLSLLKGMVSIFPSCLGNHHSSNRIVSFGACIKLLGSLTLLCHSSPDLSITLMKSCHLGSIIKQSLLNFEKSDLDRSNSSSMINVKALSARFEKGGRGSININEKDTTVSIEALVSTPKELLLSILKLIASTIPFIQHEKLYEDTDVGNYLGILKAKDEGASNKKRGNLLTDSENVEDYSKYISNVLPILINIYSATVDYRIRRLALVCILRSCASLDQRSIGTIVYDSNITTILASIISQGRNALFRYDSSVSSLDKVRPFIIIYGAFLIAHVLVTRSPKLFLRDFDREGILSHTQRLLAVLDQNESVINQSSKADVTENSNEINTLSQMSVDEEGEVFSANEYEANVNEQTNGDHGGDNYDEEDMPETDSDVSDSSNAFGSETTKSIFSSYRHLNDYEDDGATLIPVSKVLYNLDQLCHKVSADYQTLLASHGTSRSKHMKELEEISVLLSNKGQVNYTGDQWTNLWIRFANCINVGNDAEAISSFELTSSGIIDILLQTLSSEELKSSCILSFQQIFCSRSSTVGSEENLPLTILVQKLEEALERTESFCIVTSGSSLKSDSRASSMAKQLRIKLVSSDESLAESERKVLLMIHAIATFKSIDLFMQSRLNRIKNILRVFSPANQRAARNILDDEYHIEFSIDGEVIPHGTTVYGAIYRSLQKTPHEIVSPRLIWTAQPHVVNFRKISGPIDETSDELYPVEINSGDGTLEDASNLDLSSLGDPVTIEVLHLLKVLHHINGRTIDPGASDALFLNYKLTAKLNRQLEEPLIVASGTLPDWSIDITRNFPFVFPLETRVFFLQSTSFGYSRLIDLWQNRSKQQQESDNTSNSRNVVQLGRPVRHKFRLSRKKLFQGAIKVLDGYASAPGLLEIEYFDEAGTGMGPTLEFYANVSKEFCKKELHIWRDLEGSDGLYVNNLTGLFPRPIDSSNPMYQKCLHYFSALGKFIARALLDNRIVDFAFNPLFFELSKFLNLPNEARLLDILKGVDPELFNSLTFLISYLNKKDKKETSLPDLSLSYVLPGYNDVKLIRDGEKIQVTEDNLENYIRAVVQATVGNGVWKQIQAFKEGFSTVFPYSSMSIFSSNELTKLLGSADEDWSIETLLGVVKADHGYTVESASFQNLLEVLSSFDKSDRRKFLQFLTGSPKLPIGGFKALHPEFTVVRKPAEGNLKPDNYLPSVMTCANYLKLPDYSSKNILRQRLTKAMNEGANSFLLS